MMSLLYPPFNAIKYSQILVLIVLRKLAVSCTLFLNNIFHPLEADFSYSVSLVSSQLNYITARFL